MDITLIIIASVIANGLIAILLLIGCAKLFHSIKEVNLNVKKGNKDQQEIKTRLYNSKVRQKTIMKMLKELCD